MGYNFIENIIKLSIEKNDKKVLSEWKLYKINKKKFNKADDKIQCICNANIKHYACIINIFNGNIAYCGRTCIKKIDKEIKKQKQNKIMLDIYNKIIERVKYGEFNSEEYKNMVAKYLENYFKDKIKRNNEIDNILFTLLDVYKLYEIYYNKALLDNIINEIDKYIKEYNDKKIKKKYFKIFKKKTLSNNNVNIKKKQVKCINNIKIHKCAYCNDKKFKDYNLYENHTRKKTHIKNKIIHLMEHEKNNDFYNIIDDYREKIISKKDNNIIEELKILLDLYPNKNNILELFELEIEKKN